jgi:hypothetical protein
MAVNIFEELVRAALNAQGYLTFENAAYRLYDNAKSLAGKDNPYNPASDIDLIAFAPRKNGPSRTLAINCKGSREGLVLPRDVERISNRCKNSVAGTSPEKGFRELCQDDWAKAFRFCIHRWTGVKEFTHVTVVRRIEGDKRVWTTHPSFSKMLTPHLQLWDLDDVVKKLKHGESRLHMSNNMLRLVDLFHHAA